jgi:tetratricopeptide (TPR) repeat protein
MLCLPIAKDLKLKNNSLLSRSIIFTFCALALSCTATEVYAKKPINWDEKLAKGKYELSIGNTEKAIKIFDEKVKHHPESAACHVALGEALKYKGRWDEARAEFQKATEVEPGYAEGFYQLGIMQEKSQMFAQAANSFDRYVQLAPDKARKLNVEDRVRFCKENIKANASK